MISLQEDMKVDIRDYLNRKNNGTKVKHEIVKPDLRRDIY